MSSSLLMFNLKNNYKIWLIFMLIMMMYKTIIMGMYDPENAEAIEAMLEMFPPALLNAMGFNILDASLNGFLAGYYYGFIVILFPLIFTIMLSYKLIGKYVDDGSMAFLLSAPVSRQTLARTQGFTLFGMVTDLIASITLIGLIFSALLFPGELNIGRYLLLNLGVIFLFFAISGITYLCSTLFNEAKHMLGFSIGILVAFFVIDMLSSVDERLDFLQYFTLFTLFDGNKINQGDPIIYFHFTLLCLVGILSYALGYSAFIRKDLTL